VVVSNIFHVHPYLGKWSNLTNIFQLGWNHQPVLDCHKSHGIKHSLQKWWMGMVGINRHIFKRTCIYVFIMYIYYILYLIGPLPSNSGKSWFTGIPYTKHLISCRNPGSDYLPQGGPLLVMNGVMTPWNGLTTCAFGVISPQFINKVVTLLFSGFGPKGDPHVQNLVYISLGGWLSFFHQIFGPGWPSGHFAQHGGLSQPRWWIHFF